MKLQKLTIHNIASIEDAVIDFEAQPLSGSNVILITGETGSGKSTILDAICLALYATTPRMSNKEMDGKWQENATDQMDITDTLQLMRKSTSEAYARLSFRGSDGNAYEAEWHAERKRKNLSRTWSLNNLTHPDASPQPGNGKDGTKDNEMKQAIQSAVGLTFDQFCRTTMLAQGEFTRFLKSGNKDKAAILEKITNTEQYAKIGAMVYDLTHRKYEKEMNEVDPKKKEQAIRIQMKVTEDEILYIDYYDSRRQSGHRASVDQFDGKSLKSRITAQDIYWLGEDKWRLADYTKREFNGLYETIEKGKEMEITMNIIPDDFFIFASMQEQMTTKELDKYIRRQKARGIGNIKDFEIEYAKRFAFPFASFILTIIGVSLSSRKIKGGMGLNLMFGLLLSLAFILFFSVSSTFAVSGALSPTLAAWLPNIVFAGISIFLYRKARQ